MNPIDRLWSFFDGKKSCIAALGLLGLAVYDLTVKDWPNAYAHLMAALAVVGVRHAVAKSGNGKADKPDDPSLASRSVDSRSFIRRGAAAVLPFLLWASWCPVATAQQIAQPATRVTRTSLFGIAERNQMLQQHHDRLLALEAAARNQQSAPQSSGPQIHYHFWQGGPGQQPAHPQIMMLGPPLQTLPIQGGPLQQLPIQGIPLQQLPIQGAPLQQLPIQGTPKQQLPEAGQPKQQLPIQSPAVPKAMPPAPDGPQQQLPIAAPSGYQSYTRITHALAKPILSYQPSAFSRQHADR